MRFNPFRKLTIEEAHARLVAHATNAKVHHAIEAARLRYEAAVMLAQADGHVVLAELYGAQELEYGPDPAPEAPVVSSLIDHFMAKNDLFADLPFEEVPRA